jgi:hypothetical protein
MFLGGAAGVGLQSFENGDVAAEMLRLTVGIDKITKFAYSLHGPRHTTSLVYAD